MIKSIERANAVLFGEQAVENLFAKIEEAMDLLPEIKDAAENRDSARIQELGVEPRPSTPEAFSAHLKSEIAKWRKVIEHAKIPKQ